MVQNGSARPTLLYIAIMLSGLTLLGVVLVAGTGVAHAADGKAKWTVMIYVSADNDLEGYALLDLEEMEHVGSTDSVNIVVLIDRSQERYEDRISQRVGFDLLRYYGDWSGAKIFYITRGEGLGIQSRVLAEPGEIDMGDPSVLVGFIEGTVKRFPAEHYALIIWDHGSGLAYTAVDHTDRDVLTVREIGAALKSLAAKGIHLDLIGFDACLMASIETVYEVSGYADVLVASEETEPGDGWPYTDVLGYIVENPDADAAEWAKRIVDAYIASYQGSPDEPYVTLSAVDLRVLRGKLVEPFRQLSQAIQGDPGAARQARENAMSYGDSGEGPTNIDLVGFLDSLARSGISGASGLRDLVSSAIIVSKAGAKKAGSHGLSIYYPARLNMDAYNKVTGFGEETGWSKALAVAVNIAPQVSENPIAAGQVEVEGYGEVQSQTGMPGIIASLGRINMDSEPGEEFVAVLLTVSEELPATSIVVVDYRSGGLVKTADTVLDKAPDQYVFQFPMMGIDYDVDGDGAAEVIVLEDGMPGDQTQEYAKLLLVDFTGDGAPRLLRSAIARNFMPQDIAVGDVDGDGRPEALLAGLKYDVDDQGQLVDFYGRIYVISLPDLNPENKIDLKTNDYQKIVVPSGIAAGDVDGDGVDEIALSLAALMLDEYGNVVNHTGSLLLAKYTDQGLSPIAGAKYTAQDIVVGDVDADGKPDIVAGSGDSCSFRLYHVAGEGLEAYMDVDLGLGCDAVTLSILDIDGDGVNETIAIGNWYDEEGMPMDMVIRVYSLAGRPSLELTVQGVLSANMSRMPLAIDFNGDGKRELAYVRQVHGGLEITVHQITNYVNPYGRLKGRVIDANGAPVAGATVEVYVAREGGPRIHVATTGSDGSFHIDRLPAATYQVDVIRDGSLVAETVAEVRANEETTLTIQVKPAGQATTTTTTTTTTSISPTTTTPETTTTTTTTSTQTPAPPPTTTTTSQAQSPTTTTATTTHTQAPPTTTSQQGTTSTPATTTTTPTTQPPTTSQVNQGGNQPSPPKPIGASNTTSTGETGPGQGSPLLPLIGGAVAVAAAVIAVLFWRRRSGPDIALPPPPPSP